MWKLEDFVRKFKIKYYFLEKLTGFKFKINKTYYIAEENAIIPSNYRYITDFYLRNKRFQLYEVDF